MAIVMGSPATNRASAWGGLTFILKDNPANASGRITSVEIWANTNLSNCEVATFYETATDEFSTRDTHTIGSVTAGSKQTFPGLDITVETGDYIGIYCSGGNIEQDISGQAGEWYKSGDYIPCTTTAFGFAANETFSVYGTGTTGVAAVAKKNVIFMGSNF